MYSIDLHHLENLISHLCVYVDRNDSNSGTCCVFFSLVPGAAVVKGLNTLSAWVLQNGVLAGKQVREEVEIRDLL